MLLEKIYCNGVLVEPHRERIDPQSILRNNYVYTAVNTLSHEPLYLERQLSFAMASFEKLYGFRPILNAARMSQQIPKLLYENRTHRGGNIVMIYLVPHYGEEREMQPDIIMTPGRQTVYRGYELISIRPKAIVANYEIPFSEHRTAVSLAAADYMDDFADRTGHHIALRANRSGNLVSAGDYPIFAVKDGKVITPVTGSGPGNSLERELMILACRRAGVEVVEQDISVDDLPETEELMVFNHTGIQSVMSCGEVYFYNLIAIELAKQLPEITKEGM